METKIAGYKKTEHFLYRQWQRGLSDSLLFKVLNRIDNKNEKFLLIVGNKYLENSTKFKKESLFIKIKGKLLITFYYGNLSLQMYKKNKENYKILN